MHAQFLHQLPSTDDAVEVTDQRNTQQEFGNNRGSPRLTVAVFQLLPHKLKTAVTVDEPQEMVFKNSIFQVEGFWAK
jgi:hypothetical protein